MQAAIDPKYTGVITIDEARETLQILQAGHYALPQMRGAAQGATWLRTATVAQIQEVLDWYAPQLERAVKALDDANRFRPSYAPKGALTKTQAATRLEAQQLTRMVRLLSFQRDALIAKGAK